MMTRGVHEDEGAGHEDEDDVSILRMRMMTRPDYEDAKDMTRVDHENEDDDTC